MSLGRLTFLYPPLLRAAAAARGGSKSLSSQATTSAARIVPTTQATRHRSRPSTLRGGSVRLSGYGQVRCKGTFAPRHGKGVEPDAWGKETEDNESETTKLNEKASRDESSDEKKAAGSDLKAQETTSQDKGSTVAATDGAAESAPSEGSPPGADDATRTTSKDELNPLEVPVEAKSAVDAMTTTKEEFLDDHAEPDSSAAQKTDVDPDNTKAPAAEKTGEEDKAGPSNLPAPQQNGPLEAVLHMPPPETVAKQHTPLSPPRYVHHFDSYSLVGQLQTGGYSQAQAITTMKAIRTLLAKNLDVAHESLVGKRDVENEAYLFRAACSELSTEIRNNRRLQDEEMRQQRTHLQHEVDQLTQSLNQELLNLNDNTRGMFSDRKMAVSEEQKVVESAIQQINYRISITLGSDSKSEIEGVRWILIRRSVLGIVFMAFITLATLRYASYVSQESQRESERQRRREEELRRDGGKTDHSDAADAAVILSAS